jgi:hypothetical protein
MRCTATTVDPAQKKDDGDTTGPFANAHAHRWVDAPPLSGSLVGPYLHAPSRIQEQLYASAVDDPTA